MAEARIGFRGTSIIALLALSTCRVTNRGMVRMMPITCFSSVCTALVLVGEAGICCPLGPSTPDRGYPYPVIPPKSPQWVSLLPARGNTLSGINRSRSIGNLQESEGTDGGDGQGAAGGEAVAEEKI